MGGGRRVRRRLDRPRGLAVNLSFEHALAALGLALYEKVITDLANHEAHERWKTAAERVIDVGGVAGPVSPCTCTKCMPEAS